MTGTGMAHDGNMRPNPYKVGAQKRKLGMGKGEFVPGTMFEAARQIGNEIKKEVPQDIQKGMGILGLI